MTRRFIVPPGLEVVSEVDEEIFFGRKWDLVLKNWKHVLNASKSAPPLDRLTIRPAGKPEMSITVPILFWYDSKNHSLIAETLEAAISINLQPRENVQIKGYEFTTVESFEGINARNARDDWAVPRQWEKEELRACPECGKIFKPKRSGQTFDKRLCAAKVGERRRRAARGKITSN